MAYGPVVSNEAQTPLYMVTALMASVNGSAVMEVRLAVESNDPLFTPETDAVFQEVLDALDGISGLDVQVSSKTWGAARNITPSS